MRASSGTPVSLDESIWHYGIAEWELGLEFSSDDNVCLYYIASWSRRCVWWPEPLDSAKVVAEGMACDEQLYCTLQGSFWNHVEYFPHHRSLPPDAVDQLERILTFFAHDLLTSKESTMSYTRGEIGTALQLIRDLKVNLHAKGELAAIVGRQLAEIYEERAYNLHGTSLARMNRFQSRYTEPHCNRPFVNNIFARALTFVFLFNKPQSFDRKLCEAWIDHSAFYIQWKELMQDVQEEWKASAFMRLYFTACGDRWLGLYGVAMLFSVPLAMLMWAFLLFVAGVLWYSFKAFSPLARPFIMASVGIVIVVILVQGVYFYGLGPAPKEKSFLPLPPSRTDSHIGRKLQLVSSEDPLRFLPPRRLRTSAAVGS
ncbi:hypothetical protein AURDEDRAFT_165449 [Auricularia subglabra TFB-10046 SS5]|nr:hypothetical protein AURDEDRAFT_165449 [Auricularia subglabra TFB-10046 SS5]